MSRVLLYRDVIEVICAYLTDWHLLPWIDRAKLTDYGLCANPHAQREVMAMKKGQIVWSMLSSNPSEWAVDMLEQNQQKIDWLYLAANPYAADIFEYRGIVVEWLARNPSDEWWRGDPWPNGGLLDPGTLNSLIGTNQIWMNSNPIVWKLLQELREKRMVDPYYERNRNNNVLEHTWRTYDGLRDGDWEWLQLNTNDDAVTFLREHPSRIDLLAIPRNPKWTDWYLDAGHPVTTMMSSNPHPRAIAAMREHQEIINWDDFSANPGIFEYCAQHGAREALLELKTPSNDQKMNDFRPSLRMRRLVTPPRRISGMPHISFEFPEVRNRREAWVLRRMHWSGKIKRVTRAKYADDRIWEFPSDLAWIIKGYAEEERTVWIEDDGYCLRCNPDGDFEPEWPCDLHDEPQPNPEWRDIPISALKINIISIPAT